MTKATASKKTAAKKPAKQPADRSAAIAKSWNDKAVAAARSKKDHVKAGGTEFRSTAAAFQELGLPMGKHIPFRMELKSKGRAVFKGEKGNITFTIVKSKDEK